VQVQRVTTPNGPKKNAVSFALDLTRAIDTVPSFVQGDVAQRFPVVRKVALGTNIEWLGNGITAIRPRMQSQTFEALTTVQQQWTILTGVTHVFITAANTTQEKIGFFGSSKSTKIGQGCVILVHKRGERRATHTEHRQRRGGLLRHRSRLSKTIVTGLCGGNQAASLGLVVHS
jgi:ABC-type polar amino acid transport system ATPase subunit